MKQYLFSTGIIILSLTACGKSGGSADTTAQNPSNPAIVSPPASPGGPTTFDLTYYTKVATATINSGGQTYHLTMTGHCVSYLSDDYCWDDGFQSIPTGYQTSFWQLCYMTGAYGQCNGGVDPVTAPKLWTSMVSHLPLPPYQAADVYGGIATQVSCQVTGTIVDCGDFQIDTSLATF